MFPRHTNNTFIILTLPYRVLLRSSLFGTSEEWLVVNLLILIHEPLGFRWLY